MKNKILLIDGNSILNRAFYGLPILTNKDGIYTNGVYGFLNIFFKIYDEEKPTNVIVAFDVPKPTFRHLKFDMYKGTRKSMPEELKPQFALLKEVLSKMNIKIVELEGYEADDILGTLAIEYEEKNFHPIVLSGDKDLLQIASQNIEIKIPKTKAGKSIVESYFYDDVIELMGVTPKEFIDVKALMGDNSDNIPGVPSIGEKTAIKIIKENKNIEMAIRNAHNIKPKKAAENLIEFKEQAILSKELATIITNVPINIDESESLIENIFNKDAFDLIKNLEFKSLYSKFKKEENIDFKTNNQFNYKKIEVFEEAEKYFQTIIENNLVSFVSIINNNKIIGISISSSHNEATFIYLNEKDLIKICSDFLKSDIKKITLNSKQELLLYEKLNIKVNNIVFDCSLGFYILKASREKYEYNDIAEEFLSEYYPSLEEIVGKGKTKINIEEIQQELVLYACRNSDVCFRCYEHMDNLMDKYEQKSLYYNIELPLTHVLKDMEFAGIKINKEELVNYGKKLDVLLDTLVTEIYDICGVEFNINSPKQLGEILFEKLNLKTYKKTKTGYSTNAEVLENLKDKHIIIPKIIEYRTYSKLKSTYVDGLLNSLDEETQKIYSTFNQTITTTGRISSTEPNLQNIPTRLEMGREIRKIFVPTDDTFVFLDGDYSQIELRILAHLANDEVLINAFKENQDIHKLTASQVFEVPFDEVTKTQRSNAKAVNFGIIYGISSFSLSQDLNISKYDADEYINSYFNKYPKIKEYLDNTIQTAKDKGYATTIFGRRRDIPELISTNFVKRGFGQRVAMNMPIQGSAADIIKIAMINVNKKLNDSNLHSKILLQVHDELLLEVKKTELNVVKQILQEEMNNAVRLKVDMKVDFAIGNNWYETK